MALIGARTFAARRPGIAVGFAQTLDEADRAADEIELFAQLVFQEALEAEMQRRFLIGEKQESWRRGFRLRDVVNAHGARFRRRSALQIHCLEPAIQFRR